MHNVYIPVLNHNRNLTDWTFMEQGMDLVHGETGSSSTTVLENIISEPNHMPGEASGKPFMTRHTNMPLLMACLQMPSFPEASLHKVIYKYRKIVSKCSP
jgi:hypothetical protein